MLQKLFDEVNIGPEFTFRKKDWVFTMEDIQRGCAVAMEAPALVEAAVKKERLRLDNEEVHLYKEAAISKYQSAVNARRLELRAGSACRYWICLDLDPNCLEITAMPKPLRFYMNNPDALSAVIFHPPKACGLYADPTAMGGGGHINLDAKLALGNKDATAVLRNLVVLYTCCAYAVRENIWDEVFARLLDMQKDIFSERGLTEKMLQKYSFLTEVSDKDKIKDLFRYDDPVNAPQICDYDRGLWAFRRVIGEMDGRMIRDSSVWADGFQKSFYIQYAPEADELRGEGQPKPPPEIKAWYQAINLSSLLRDKSPRIEFRAFGAQDNIGRFIDDAQGIFCLVLLARLQATCSNPAIDMARLIAS